MFSALAMSAQTLRADLAERSKKRFSVSVLVKVF
jgi:hypothetical protein